jgi:hypothetical protein
MRRFFIVLLGLAIIALVVFRFWHPATFGTGIGLSATPATPGGRWFSADTPRAGAGVHKGDLVDLGSASNLQRWRLRAAPYGYEIPVRVRRGGQEMSLRLTAKFPPRLPVDWIEILTDFVWIGLATIIAARKPNAMTVSFLAFTAFLLPYGPLTTFFGFMNDAAFTAAIYVVPPLIATFPNFFLAAFAVRFPSGLTKPWRRSVSVAIYVAMAIVLISDAILLPQLTASWDWYQELSLAEIWIMAAGVFAIAIASYIQATAAERPRIGLVLAGLTISIGATTLFDTYTIVQPNVTQALNLVVDALRIVGLALPLSVAYAVLRYRVIDVGFALNRTAAYGITSVVLIALFAALEWGAERFITASNHVESALIDLAIVLIVVFSFRFVHIRVDRAVDNVLFRKRHEDEAALRRFEENAHFYTDAAALLRDALEVIKKRCEVKSAAIYLRSASGYAPAVTSFAQEQLIDANDAALVDVRAHRSVVDLGEQHSSVPGIRLYPMLVAADLAGFLTIGERDGYEEMPADIDRALTSLVTSLAHSLHALQHTEKEAEIARLRDQLAAVSLKGIQAQFG